MTEESIIEKVGSDPSLNAAEKETSISMFGDEKKFKIFSAKSTIVKSLLQHDHFEAEWVAGVKDDEYVTADRSDADTLDEIYSISGTCPVGLLTVKSKPRSTNHQSGIVNHKTIDPEAFE